jgi:hypothetical protein
MAAGCQTESDQQDSGKKGRMTSKKQQKKRMARRIQLEFDPFVKKALKELSDELGVSQSQIAQFFIMTGMRNTQSMSKYLEPSDAPMWQYRINFDRLKRDLGIKDEE